MAHPVPWPKRTYFYPTGNTPATNFVQHLPPEDDAKILLVGSGDPRSILFTVFSDTRDSLGPRKLDITCCDFEPAIYARNILLFTLIHEKTAHLDLWNIFFHFFLDERTFDILVKQCRLLLSLSEDPETWRASKYAYLKFSTSHTLSEVRRHWSLYEQFHALSRSSRATAEISFRVGMADVRNTTTKGVSVFTSIRAGGPCAMFMLEIAGTTWERYWKTGIADAGGESPPPLLNPTFVYSLAGNQFRIHYGTDPLLGFHLAPVLASTPSVTYEHLVRHARNEFGDWCQSFSSRMAKKNPNLSIRFIVGECLSVCRALAFCSQNRTTDTDLYTTPWTALRISFDPEDYSPNSSQPAPMAFNLIDTSNLSDHVGLLNMLIVALPIMDHGPSAVINTSTLVSSYRATSLRASITDLLCADVPTFATLFGVTPVNSMAHFQATFNKNESLMTLVAKNYQIHEIVSWRRPFYVLPNQVAAKERALSSPTKISCDPIEFANCIHSISNAMFETEEFIQNIPLKGDSVANSSKLFTSHYTRTSLATLLSFLRPRIDTDWEGSLGHLFQRLTSDEAVFFGKLSFQEDFACQLHINNLTPSGLPPYQDLSYSQDSRVIAWKDIPPVVTVALVIPRARIDAVQLMDLSSLGVPFFQCSTADDETFTVNIFTDVQCLFGKASTIGKRQPQIKIDEDPLGWNGESDFIALFNVPASFFMTAHHTEARNRSVALAFRRSPSTSSKLSSTLGHGLTIFSAYISDRKHVHVVPLHSSISRSTSSVDRTLSPVPADRSTGTLHTTVFDQNHNVIAKVTIRRLISSDSALEALRNGASVTINQEADCVWVASFGNYEETFVFPFPVKKNGVATRIARKSGYIELEGTFRPSFEDSLDVSLNAFPLLRSPVPRLLHIPYVNFGRLPKFDPSLGKRNFPWISPHCGMMFSPAERALQKRPMDEMGGIVSLKESIMTLIYHYTGTAEGKPQTSMFAMSTHLPGGVAPDVVFFLFVNGLHFDLGTNNLVLDAFVIPVNMPNHTTIVSALGSVDPLQFVILTEEEIPLWEVFLPAAAERCREWSHTEKCEHLTRRGEERGLCSCGRGKGMGELRSKPTWLRKLVPIATRVALSPLYTFVFELKTGSDGDVAERNKGQPQLPSQPPSASACAACRGPGKPSLSACSACKVVKYCSSDCQKAHWKVHKRTCKKP